MQLTKRTLSFAVLALAGIGLASAADLGVGVSITLAQPGVYGRIDLGNAPPPQVVYAQPVLVQPGQYAPPPVYLYVPPGHQRNWRRHCAEYRACGVPVYFVRDDWYHREYEPRYAQPEHRGGEMRDEGRREEGRREGGERRFEGREGGGRRDEGRGEGRRERGGDDRR